MKKALPFLLLMYIITTTFPSCKKDKEVVPETLGEKWFFDKGLYEEYNLAGVLLYTHTDSVWTVNDYLLLAGNGRFELVQNGRKLIGTYLIENSIMTLTYQQSNGYSFQTIALPAMIMEKTDTKFVFFVEEEVASSKFKTTIFMKR